MRKTSFLDIILDNNIKSYMKGDEAYKVSYTTMSYNLSRIVFHPAFCGM